MLRLLRRTFKGTWGRAQGAVTLCLLTATAGSGQLTLRSAGDQLPVPGATIRPLASVAGEASVAGGGEGVVASDGQGQVWAWPEGKVMEIRAIGFEPLVLEPDTVQGSEVWLQPATYAIASAVVTGQFSGRTVRDAAQSIQVIPRQDIDRIGAVSLRDILLTQSTVNVSQDAQLGSGLSMLGLSGQHVQVLIDGLPVIGRVDGNIDLDQLPLDNVRQVEIVEGPMSVEYGSEAIAGTINLITEGGETPGGSARVIGETIGRSQVMVNHTASLSPSLQLESQGSRLFFNGYNPPGTEGRQQLWKPKTQLNGSLRLSRKGDGLRISGALNAMHETLYNDGNVQYRNITRPISDTLIGVYATPFAQDSRFVTERYISRVDVDGQVGKGRIDGFAAHNFYRRQRITELLNLSDLSVTALGDPGMNDTAVFATWHSRVTYDLPLHATAQLLMGVDGQHETAQGERILGQRQTLSNGATFGALEWAPNARWLVRPGLRAIWNSAYNAPLIPSLHVRWRRNVHSVRASFARGFRAPELKELYFLFVDINHNIEGSAALRAEVSESWQAGYSADILTERALIRPAVRVFHNDVNDLIELGLIDAETQLYTYLNVGRSVASGITTSFDRAADRWSIRGQVTGLKRRVWLSESDSLSFDNTSLQSAISADFRASDRLSLTLQANHEARQTLLQQSDEGAWQQAILSPNLQVALFGNLAMLKDRLSIRVGVNNLFNITQRTMTGDLVNSGNGPHNGGGAGASQPVAMGRTVRIALQWNFE